MFISQFYNIFYYILPQTTHFLLATFLSVILFFIILIITENYLIYLYLLILIY